MHAPFTLMHAALLPLSLLAAVISAQGAPRVHMAGDSTMSDKSDAPPNLERGWGQMLREFALSPGTVVNHAQNGRSTVSFIAEGRWDRLLAGVAPGDFVIIQFAHNDEKQKDPAAHAAPGGKFRANLTRFVRDVRARSAEPILATPICRRKFDASGKLIDTHGDFPGAVRAVAAAEKVALLDMTTGTWRLLTELGPEKSVALFMHVPAGKYPEFPKGLRDDTHLNAEGGRTIARLAIREMREKGIAAAALFRD